jgi:hypothetical protein
MPDAPERFWVGEVPKNHDPKPSVRQFDPRWRIVPNDPAALLAPDLVPGHAEPLSVAAPPASYLPCLPAYVPDNRQFNHRHVDGSWGWRNKAAAR